MFSVEYLTSPEFLTQISETVTVAIAFIIFVAIMKKYAWGPVIHVLDERQRSIEKSFADIERKKAEAADLERQYQEKIRNIEQERRARIQDGIAEGRRVAAELLDHAREDAAQNAERSRRNLELEVAQARVQLRDELVTMTVKASERLLRTRLDEPEQRRLVTLFIDDLERQAPS